MIVEVVPNKELTLNGKKVPSGTKVRLEANVAEAWLKAGLARVAEATASPKKAAKTAPAKK